MSSYLKNFLTRKESNEAITRTYFDQMNNTLLIDTVVCSLGETKDIETLSFTGKLTINPQYSISRIKNFILHVSL